MSLTEIFLTATVVLLRILSNPVANVFQKQLARKANPLLINFFTYFILGIFCIFLTLGVDWKELPAAFWIYSILGGFAGGLGNGFLVKALKDGDLSVLGPINSYKSVVGVIFGIILLGEVPNLWGALGIMLIIYGSYFVLETTDDRFTWALLKRKEIQFRLWAMILTAIEAVFIKKIILASTPLLSFVSWCWFGAIFSLAFLLIDKTGSHKNDRKVSVADLSKYMYLVICIGIMQIATTYSFDHMPVGYALSLFQLSTIVSVLLGYRIFQEGHIDRKLLGSAIMIAGSVLIILLKE